MFREGCFQSQLGSIGAHRHALLCARPIHLSIPAWFDWRFLRVVDVAYVHHLSIPAWFDWRHGCSSSMSSTSMSFNPSLVRLAPVSEALDAIGQTIFQSQLGSIGASPSARSVKVTWYFQSQLGSIGALPGAPGGADSAGFQSQLGSIGARPVVVDVAERVPLSIPAWFDWRRRTRSLMIMSCSTFNPSLVRLALLTSYTTR